MPHPAARIVASVLLGALLLNACASAEKPSQPAFPNIPGLENLQAGECNPALAALIGGAIGALVYEENRARGAAVGAGLGALACAIINATSKQTRPPGEVEREYRAGHQGQLPDQPTISVYDTAFNAAGSVRGGQEARVVSSITVVQGAKDPVREVREVLEVFEPARTERVMLRAEKSVEEGARVGGIQNTFTVRLPQGMAAGNYPARTTLYVNGKPVGENRGTLRVLGSGRDA